MKSFIYTRSEKRVRDGSGTIYTIRIYRVKNGTPTYVCGGSDTFVSEFQQFMMHAERCKLLPRAAFVRNQFGGYKYCYGFSLRDAGFANVNQL